MSLYYRLRKGKIIVRHNNMKNVQTSRERRKYYELHFNCLTFSYPFIAKILILLDIF